MTSIVVAPALAAADDEDDLPAFDHALHWQVEPGMRVGSVTLDGAGVGGFGGVLDAGVRYGRVMLLLDLSEIGVDETDVATSSSATARGGGGGFPTTPSDGTLDRVGVAARVYVWRGLQEYMLGDVWLSGGAGEQTYAWSAGGVLHRRDVMAGFGATFGMRGSHWKADQRRWWGGTTLAFYAIYAGRKDDPQGIACGGPCDMPTAPSRTDRTLLMDWTIPFGE